MRANFRADSVFQRRDNFAARRVVLGICREHKQDVERHPDRVTLNLHIPFLHDIEQPHLNFARQIRQLVDRKDAAIGAGKQSVVNRQLVGKIAAAARRLNRVHIANHVGDGDVRGSQLFDVAVIARKPCDRRRIAFRSDSFAAHAADRDVRIVVDLTSGYHGHLRIHKLNEPAKDSRFGLSPQPEENEMMARKYRVDDLRNHRVVIPMDAGEQRLPLLHFAEKIFAELLAQRPVRNALL